MVNINEQKDRDWDNSRYYRGNNSDWHIDANQPKQQLYTND
jgi:hypothetical protein